MPQNITDVSEFTSPIVAPADGDDRDASSVLGAFQALANRARLLYNILTVDGVTLFRLVQSTTDLKNLTSPANGQIALLYTGSTPRLFIFRGGTALGSDEAGFAYNSTTAVGFWATELYYLTTGSGSTLRMDAQTLAVPNRVVLAPTESAETTGETNATTGGSLFGPTVSLTLAAGDLVLLDASCLFLDNGADATGRVSIAVDGTEINSTKQTWSTAVGTRNLHMSALYTASSAATYSIRMYQLATEINSGTPKLSFPKTVRALAIRP